MFENTHTETRHDGDFVLCAHSTFYVQHLFKADKL